MNLILDILGLALMVTGSFFCFLGALGILAFPDVYCRAHATSVTDTLGAGLVLVGLALMAPSWLVVVKLLAIFAFLLITGPASEHALMRAAYHGGVEAEVDDAWVSPALDEPLVEERAGEWIAAPNAASKRGASVAEEPS